MKREFLFLIVAGFIISLIAIGMTAIILSDNVKNSDAGKYQIHIPSGAEYNDVRAILVENDIIKNIYSFDWVANKMNYKNSIEPGLFTIPNSISNKSLITNLRNGFKEDEVKLAIHSIDTRKELSKIVSHVLEIDSTILLNALYSDSIAASFDKTVEALWGIVLADTYNFNWDTNTEEFLNRMQYEYQTYWNSEREAKAKALGLSAMDCIILASIIEKESIKTVEYRSIAGVYVNRLKRDWPLQADPTVKYALQQPELKRILKIHLSVDSPYNTYKHTGLPPGPIGLPEKTSIEAVLDAEHHDFMYFCANADFSGYHVFAKTLREHNHNARKYQNALNEKDIR